MAARQLECKANVRTMVNCISMACSGVLGASKDTGHSLYTCGQRLTLGKVASRVVKHDRHHNMCSARTS